MNSGEAFKLLREGTKIRAKRWTKAAYLFKNGSSYGYSLNPYSTALDFQDAIDGDWEVYDPTLTTFGKIAIGQRFYQSSTKCYYRKAKEAMTGGFNAFREDDNTICCISDNDEVRLVD